MPKILSVPIILPACIHQVLLLKSKHQEQAVYLHLPNNCDCESPK